MNTITRIGLDLAKSVFEVHAVNAQEQVVLRRSLRRAQLLKWFAKLSPCLIGMEACGTAHHWARELTRLGHDVRLIPPAYVKAYLRRNKTDAADAAAICEAVSRPSMRFVPVRSVEQQATTVIHKVREMLVKQRTMITNSLRGLLAEFGVTVPEGTRHVSELSARVADPEDTTIPSDARVALSGMIEVLDSLNEQITALETRIRMLVRENEGMRRLQTIPGVVPSSPRRWSRSSPIPTISTAVAISPPRSASCRARTAPAGRSSLVGSANEAMVTYAVCW